MKNSLFFIIPPCLFFIILSSCKKNQAMVDIPEQPLSIIGTWVITNVNGEANTVMEYPINPKNVRSSISTTTFYPKSYQSFDYEFSVNGKFNVYERTNGQIKLLSSQDYIFNQKDSTLKIGLKQSKSVYLFSQKIYNQNLKRLKTYGISYKYKYVNQPPTDSTETSLILTKTPGLGKPIQ